MRKHVLRDQLDVDEPVFWSYVAGMSKDEAVARLQRYWTDGA